MSVFPKIPIKVCLSLLSQLQGDQITVKSALLTLDNDNVPIAGKPTVRRGLFYLHSKEIMTIGDAVEC